MSGPKITFIGAGSVEFTGDAARRHPRLPGASGGDDLPPRHRRRAARDRDRGRPGDRPQTRAPTPTIEASADRRARARGRRLRDQHDPGRRPRRDRRRPRDPGQIRPAPDDRRHARRRRRLPRAADDPGDGRDRRRHGRGLPRRLAPQLHEPDGDPLPGHLHGDAAEEDRRPLPLGPQHRPKSSPSWSACRTRRSTFIAAGVNHQAFMLRFERDGEDLYPLLDARLARTRS